MAVRWTSLVLVAMGMASALAAPPEPGTSAPGFDLAERAARRFPQPVRVGDLINRQVLQPTPAQHVLGRVAAINRNDRGGIDVVVRFGGFFGWGARPIAVPVEAVALLGEHVAVMDFTPDQLRDFPTLSGAKDLAIPLNETIRMGLTKPFH